jgi:hypothetical protein
MPYEMIKKVLIITGGSLNILWGTAHLFPTISVVNGFGKISQDNKLIILMEWVNEGLTLIFIGTLVIMVTIIGDHKSKVVKSVYILVFLMLMAMSILSFFTGFNIDFLPFRLCPLIFSVSGILIFQGAFGK